MNRIAEPDLPAEAIHGCLELLPSMSWLLDMGTAGVEVETPRHLTNPNRMRPRWSSSQVLHPSCHVEHVWGKATSKNRRQSHSIAWQVKGASGKHVVKIRRRKQKHGPNGPGARRRRAWFNLPKSLNADGDTHVSNLSCHAGTCLEANDAEPFVLFRVRVILQVLTSREHMDHSTSCVHPSLALSRLT